MERVQRFTQREVNQIFHHISVKTLRWWGLMKLYEWVSESPDGRGVNREYVLANLYQIGIVQELSSLNVPVLIIRMFMGQNFRTSPMGSLIKRGKRGESIETDECPLKDVVGQMEKILLIRKTLERFISIPGKPERISYGWNSFLINRLDVAEVIQSLLIPKKPGDLNQDIIKRYEEAYKSGTLHRLAS